MQMDITLLSLRDHSKKKKMPFDEKRQLINEYENKLGILMSIIIYSFCFKLF